MSKTLQASRSLLDQINCFGDYAQSDPLCARHCALRLRCAIEQGQLVRMEMLDDLITSEALPIKIQ